MPHVRHEVGRADIRGQAVVFREVADDLPHVHPLRHCTSIPSTDAVPLVGGMQAEQDADERALAGAVGADESDDSRLDVQREGVEGEDAGEAAW